VWDLGSCELKSTVAFPSSAAGENCLLYCAGFSPDGKYIVAGGMFSMAVRNWLQRIDHALQALDQMKQGCLTGNLRNVLQQSTALARDSTHWISMQRGRLSLWEAETALSACFHFCRACFVLASCVFIFIVSVISDTFLNLLILSVAILRQLFSLLL